MIDSSDINKFNEHLKQSKIYVRPAEKDDVRDIAEICVEDWKIAYKGIIGDDFLDSMNVDDRYRIEVKRYDKQFVATDGDKVLGYSWLEEADDEARMTAIGLLRDMESVQPKMLYINWQLDRQQEDDLKDNALESLTAMGEAVVQPILQQISKANDAGREALLEVLCHFPGNEQIFRIALDAFRKHPEKRALFAGYLAKLGDDRALEDLAEAANAPGLPYLTFIELRNAIESRGGTCPNREYDDDPEYEALRDLDRI